MRAHLIFACVLVPAAAVLWALGAPAAEADRVEQQPAKILSPKDGAEVEESEELEGRLDVTEGYPVVLLRPLARDEPWYVQEFVEEVKGGVFNSRIVVGDKATKPGTKFRLVIVVAKSQDA